MLVVWAAWRLVGMLAQAGGSSSETTTIVALIVANVAQGGVLLGLLLKKNTLALWREVAAAQARADAAEAKLTARDVLWEEKYLPVITQMPQTLTAVAESVEKLTEEQRSLLVEVRIMVGKAG